jgi:hypothetical protein
MMWTQNARTSISPEQILYYTVYAETSTMLGEQVLETSQQKKYDTTTAGG